MSPNLINSVPASASGPGNRRPNGISPEGPAVMDFEKMKMATGSIVGAMATMNQNF
jgi:hypothetical protein